MVLGLHLAWPNYPQDLGALWPTCFGSSPPVESQMLPTAGGWPAWHTVLPAQGVGSL